MHYKICWEYGTITLPNVYFFNGHNAHVCMYTHVHVHTHTPFFFSVRNNSVILGEMHKICLETFFFYALETYTHFCLGWKRSVQKFILNMWTVFCLSGRKDTQSRRKELDLKYQRKLGGLLIIWTDWSIFTKWQWCDMQLVIQQSRIMSNSCFMKRTSDFIPKDGRKPLTQWLLSRSMT